MLPKIAHSELINPLYQEFANSLQRSQFQGEINCQYSARLAVATDNSIYQQLPQLVLHPRNTKDVQTITTLANQPKFADIKFSARGGGTGTNGQSLTPGIVIDLLKYMNRIIEINLEENWVKVEAGVVKDQLNDYLRPYGVFFSPDLSTSNRATIGGMINTDASGQGSLVYGKTSDHVVALHSVLANGDILDTEPMSIEQARKKSQQSNSSGRIIKQVLNSCFDNRVQILAKFPRLNRFLTGYDLENVFNKDLSSFDLSRIITGSEGSLAIVCQAKLNLTPIAKFKVLINVKYDSFDSALRHAPFLVSAKATSVETIDSKVLNLAKADLVWHTVSDLLSDVDGKTMEGINMVEFNSNDKSDLDNHIQQLTTQLEREISANKGVIGYQITSDQQSISNIYTMRKKAVGLLGNTQGNKKPLAFVEDTAVPPQNLANFIAEFRALLDAHQLDYGMFGHVDAGVLHVRPALDMCDPEQEKLLRQVSDQVVALTAKYGGLMWGEHGKGYRSEYGPEFFGEQLFLELRKIKTAFDPSNKMNPGKICTPLDSNEKLVSIDAKKRGNFDREIPIEVKSSFDAALSCNGNGLCFNYDENSPMCPSSKVTRDRRQSPKGRAGLMREWLRLLEHKGVDILTIEKNIQNWSVKKLLNTVKNRFSSSTDDDFSHEVMEAMQGCLACKACASQCPIKVNVPDFRSRFIQLYYSRYPRPVSDHLVANVEKLTPLMAKAPVISNKVLSSSWYRAFSERTIGYLDTPLLSVPTLAERCHQNGFDQFDFNHLTLLSQSERDQYVCIVQDPFTSFYEAEAVVDLMNLVKKLGFKPLLLPFHPNGKAQHVKGFLTKFASTAKTTAAFLNQIADLKLTIVGLDASTVLCYRDEYQQILKTQRGNFDVLLAHEWLQTNLSNINVKLNHQLDRPFTYRLFSHCTEKTALAKSEQQWQTIFAHFHLPLELEAVGCCGMAGTYGHEKSNYEYSKALYEMSWQRKIEPLEAEQALVTGFSCRSQIKRLAGKRVKHPVSALVANL